ncbi:hypothetical protein PIB30_058086 [Stylosanthes scabra]|uniref:Uncharacterized protein n=1 Tax=Stylosanthes scabra TaxID=79078 RepID=A0ABU6TKR5_9FABA|nr:hypothetical protein [Stylosanthes scabra]
MVNERRPAETRKKETANSCDENYDGVETSTRTTSLCFTSGGSNDFAAVFRRRRWCLYECGYECATYTATPLPAWPGGNCPREPTLQPLQNTFQNPKAFHLYGSNLPKRKWRSRIAWRDCTEVSDVNGFAEFSLGANG